MCKIPRARDMPIGELLVLCSFPVVLLVGVTGRGGRLARFLR